MNESGGRNPQTKEDVSVKPNNGFDCSADTDDVFELLRLRLEGVYEDIKGVLSAHDPGAESSRRLYFAATAIGRVVEYLAQEASA
jgi:hypothetical protein